MIHNCDWRELIDHVPECDALIVDAPYSERTHEGHDASTVAMGPYQKSNGRWQDMTKHGELRQVAYAHWTPDDVRAFVAAWSPRTRGWFVSLTDHALEPAWTDALEADGRYVFSPLPFVAQGSRVRLAGDGPSSWTTWIVVARPRTREMARWGTLPGAYVLPPGEGGAMPLVGGKPLWIMERLVEDYSRPGDLVCDPCCGAGTTLVAAVRLGRRAVGGDANPEHAAIARRWLADPGPRAQLGGGAVQVPLFGEGG